MIDDALAFAIEPLVPEFAPDIYEGAASEYCTYNYVALPRLHANGRPGAIVYLVQVHFVTENGRQVRRKLINLKNALFSAGFTYPSEENASDKDGQHYVLECQYKDGEV